MNHGSQTSSRHEQHESPHLWDSESFGGKIPDSVKVGKAAVIAVVVPVKDLDSLMLRVGSDFLAAMHRY